MTRLFALALCLAACNGSTASSPCADLGANTGSGCVIPPSAPLARSSCSDPTTSGAFCDDTGTSTPSLACLAPVDAGTPVSSSTDRIAISGFVGVFATGPDTNHVDVSAFTATALANGADPSTLTPVDHDDVCFYFKTTAACTNDTDCATGSCLDNDFCAPDADTPSDCTLATANDLIACDADPTLGCVAPQVDGCATECDDGLAGRRDKQQYCHPTSDGAGSCRPRARWLLRYLLPSVLADQEVVLRVSGLDGEPDAHFQSAIAPGIVATKSRPCADVTKSDCYDAGANVYRRDVVAMSRLDYDAIAQRAGLPSGITPGRGAILGEVHDCDGVRIGNAQVVATPTPGRSTYFSDAVPAQPVPDATRAAFGTDARGLYGELDLQPGIVTVTPWGFLTTGGALEQIGPREVRVYADTYTLIDLGGGHPGH